MFKELVVDWIRHATCTITLSEVLVNVALIIYFFQSETVEVTKTSIVSEREDCEESTKYETESDEISSELADFVEEFSQSVKEELSMEYQDLRKSSSPLAFVNRNYYRTVYIVKRIVAAARARRLRVGHTYFVAENDSQLFVETRVCCGLYPDLPKKKEKPTEEHFSAPRFASYTTKGVASTLSKKDLQQITTDTFTMPNKTG
jgi:hypothetical protein